MSAEVRPMVAADVAEADRVAHAAMRTVFPDAVEPEERIRTARGVRRIEHLLVTDPNGAWVAVDPDGAILGVALALVREGLWGLSLLAVDADRHGEGVGGALLRAALGTAAGCRGGIILSSEHPAAMRSYARAGFALRPAVAVSGIVDRRAVPGGLRSRPGDVEADRGTIDRASRHVRGASHARDVPVLLQRGARLWVLPDRGFVVAESTGNLVLLAAVDEEAATDLLWTAWAEAPPGATLEVDPITAGHDWIVRAGLEAGLALSAVGPVFTRGDVGPFAPYVPSGVFL